MPRWRVIQEIPSDELTEWFAFVQMPGYREKWESEPAELSNSAVQHRIFHGLKVVDQSGNPQ